MEAVVYLKPDAGFNFNRLQLASGGVEMVMGMRIGASVVKMVSSPLSSAGSTIMCSSKC